MIPWLCVKIQSIIIYIDFDFEATGLMMIVAVNSDLQVYDTVALTVLQWVEFEAYQNSVLRHLDPTKGP